MKGSKIILRLAVATIFAVVPMAIFSQTEKLDIFEYTPPTGWTKSPKDGVMVYLDTNKTAGTFCVLSVYPSSPSVGDPQKDFANEWSELIVKPFKADTNPKTDNQTEDGWTTVSGAADRGQRDQIICDHDDGKRLRESSEHLRYPQRPIVSRADRCIPDEH